jgi:FkbM family methyltransferase
VLDIGANMGFFTCPAAIAAPQGRVIAVEPLTGYTDVLRRNIDRNKLKNVTVIQTAAATTSGEQIALTVWYTKSGELKTGTPPKSMKVAIEVASGLTLADSAARFLTSASWLAQLARFDTESTHLQLTVGAADIGEFAVSPADRNVAGLIGAHRAAGALHMQLHETRGCQFGLVQITVSHTRTRYVHLAGPAIRDGTLCIVEQKYAQVGNRHADRILRGRYIAPCHTPVRHMDSCFREAVHIDQRRGALDVLFGELQLGRELSRSA